MCVLLLAVVEMMPEEQVLEEFNNVVEHVVMITEKMKMIKVKSIRSQKLDDEDDEDDEGKPPSVSRPNKSVHPVVLHVRERNSKRPGVLPSIMAQSARGARIGSR